MYPLQYEVKKIVKYFIKDITTNEVLHYNDIETSVNINLTDRSIKLKYKTKLFI